MTFRTHPAGKEVIAAVIILLATIGLAAIMFIPFRLFWLAMITLLVLLGLGLFVASFFRYPNRKAPSNDGNAVFSSADGKVVVVEKTKSSLFPEGEAVQISVFMSIYNVHLNYVPCAGTIISSEHRDGLHLMAIRPKASLENEQCETTIETSSGHKIIVRQIAGAAARRVLTFVEPGQAVKAGEELGFIRFGSRVDHIVPASSTILVSPGDVVKGCITKIAELTF